MKLASLRTSSRGFHCGLLFLGPVERIDDFAIAVVAILRQRMAIAISDVEGVHLALFLKRFCRS
ncbi:MAG TPA: hypothetical protein VHM88_24575, partial [Candidatus Acidoferrales bacterium]|nr:hypothetical protein [Candidatus Acidoferrales bacterium]